MGSKQRNSNRLLGTTLALLAGILLVLCLPFLGVVSVIVRVTLLVAAFLAVVGGLILYRANHRFRSWFAAKLDEQPRYKGLRLRDGVSLAAGHSWLRSERQRAILGADDLAQRVLGPIDAVELPEAGHRIELGKPYMTLRHGERRVSLRSPVTGTVVRRNTILLDEPHMLNEDPYGLGWTVELREERPRRRAPLFDGSRAREWFHDEVDRLIATVQPISQYGPAMADGGALVLDLHRVLDEACWQRVRRDFFDISMDEELP